MGAAWPCSTQKVSIMNEQAIPDSELSARQLALREIRLKAYGPRDYVRFVAVRFINRAGEARDANTLIFGVPFEQGMPTLGGHVVVPTNAGLKVAAVIGGGTRERRLGLLWKEWIVGSFATPLIRIVAEDEALAKHKAESIGKIKGLEGKVQQQEKVLAGLLTEQRDRAATYGLLIADGRSGRELMEARNALDFVTNSIRGTESKLVILRADIEEAKAA